jgi:hypothetical protein
MTEEQKPEMPEEASNQEAEERTELMSEEVLRQEVEYEVEPQQQELSDKERKIVAAWLNKMQATLIAANQNDRLAADPLGGVINELIDAFSYARAAYKQA